MKKNARAGARSPRVGESRDRDREKPEFDFSAQWEFPFLQRLSAVSIA